MIWLAVLGWVGMYEIFKRQEETQIKTLILTFIGCIVMALPIICIGKDIILSWIAPILYMGVICESVPELQDNRLESLPWIIVPVTILTYLSIQLTF